MPTETRIELTEKAKEVLQDLKTAPEWILPAIAKGMDKANAFMVSHIQSAHLTGTGPFPVSEHRLGIRTNRLRGGVWAAPATVSGGNEVQSSIGDNVAYAAIHEFGGVVHHEARQGKVRLLVNAKGELERQFGFDHLAVFARTEKKVRKKDARYKEVAYSAEAHDTVMPERAPFRTGIAEKLQEYGEDVSAVIVATWRARQ